MKYKISYFYKIRFFKPWQIPVSTAIWDPKWFHKGTGNNKVIFKDKNGVYNGLRYEALTIKGANAQDDCRGKDGIGTLCNGDANTCTFLSKYRSYLNSLSFDEVDAHCKKLADQVKAREGFEEEPEIILIVYETPDNPCSERPELIRYFKEHNIDLEEF